MNDNPDFFRARAEEEQANADAATLDNVRDRCERAAKAWSTMADRAERTQTMRLTREAATREAVASAQTALAAE
ncbi:hypothetical protein [Sphingomonas bacterium]|uniref:hypothetical protein n=1 Tax=Sphingomonas bacterium TaxID=1895847 RepID=UPI0015754362|nr:hypothetical protein [Sphingomonas bacterium]